MYKHFLLYLLLFFLHTVLYIYIYILYSYNFYFTAFKTIEGTQAWGQKFIFFIGNCVNIVLALYKCQSMGLLPTHASDWLAFINQPTRMEYSGGGFVLS